MKFRLGFPSLVTNNSGEHRFPVDIYYDFEIFTWLEIKLRESWFLYLQRYNAVALQRLLVCNLGVVLSHRFVYCSKFCWWFAEPLERSMCSTS